MLSDLRLPDGNGIDLLRWMRKEGLALPFIIMTDYAEVHTAVESMKLGSLDYIPKLLVEDKLVPLLRNIQKEQDVYKRQVEGRKIRSEIQATAYSTDCRRCNVFLIGLL